MTKTVAAILLLMLLGAASNMVSQSEPLASTAQVLTVGHVNYFGSSDDLRAERANTRITVDGILNESIWDRPGLTGFTQREPDGGEPASQSTVVWIAYDDEALYVAAKLYDSSPDSIASEMGRRDQDLQSDWFGITVDSYHDRQTGFYFIVTPGGVITDGTISNDSWFNDTWDGVWDYAASVDTDGWSAEMRIPYSQLRFTQQKEYTWGFNAARFIHRRQEFSHLKWIPKESSQDVSLYPSLTGIQDITPPRRFEVLPYLVASGRFLDFDESDPFGRDREFYRNAGADIKIGLGSNFTLDGTINPDFGQVELDPAVVNLSAFETFFSERRPFFVEGSSIFRFGNRGATNNWGFNSSNPSFFYSRRIGRAPQGSPVHDGEADIPDNTTILTAGKISGKTKGNWEIGAVQAVTAREYARVDSAGTRFEDEVEPLTSYSVVRAFKNFTDNRYGLGVLATSTLRDLRTEKLTNTLRKSALTGGLDGYAFLGAEKKWALSGWLGGSHLTGSEQVIANLQRAPQHYYQRPDFEYTSLDTTRTALSGTAGRIALNREKGNYYLNAAIGVNSPGFDTNDLGFHWRGNVINQHLVVGHRWFQKTKYTQSAFWYLSSFRNFDFDGNHIAEGLMTFVNVQLHNFWWLRMNAGFFPKTKDINRTRGGPIMENPTGGFGYASVQTDSRKPIILSGSYQYSRNTPGGWDSSIDGGVEWRPNSRLSMEISPSYFRDHAIAQWITAVDDISATSTYGKRYIFGILDQRQLSASIRINYTFTPRLTLQMYAQPLFAAGEYSDIKELSEPGTFDFIHYGEGNTRIDRLDDGGYEVDPDGSGMNNYELDNPDFNFKSLRGTAILRWEYAPGSTLFLVWTQDRSDFENQGDFNLSNDADRLLNARADNIILLKMSYWWNP